MKKAFIVCGPESSGNHLMTSVLIKHGCQLELKLDFTPPKDGLVVWQGSMPKDTRWYSISDVAKKYRKYDYDVVLIVLSRSWFAMASSQVKNHRPNNLDEAYAAIRRAYRHIFSEIEKINLKYVVVNYESLIYEQDKFLQKLMPLIFGDEVDYHHQVAAMLPDQCELNTKKDRYGYYFNEEFYDANSKWIS